jgi:hypothetical protein
MPNVKRILFVTVAVFLAGASAAPASTIPMSDLFNPSDVFFDGQESVVCIGANGALLDTTSASVCKSLSWTQTLPGYNSATDTLTSGTLTLTAYNDRTDNNHAFKLLVDLLTFDGSIADSATLLSPNTFGFSVLSQLADGGVNVTLTSQNGNHTFYFAQAELNALADRVTENSSPAAALTAMPEPGSMLLVGTVLVGWAGRRLRRRR